MKIIHCLYTMETGGAQVLVIDLMNEMYRLGHDVYLIIINDKINPDLLATLNSNIPVIKINRAEGSRNPYFIFKLNLYFFRLNPDIIHYHEPKGNALVYYPFYKSVYTVHDTGLDKKVLRHFDSVVAISNSVADDIKNFYPKKVPVINNGCHISAFIKRKQYDIPDTFKLVQVSRLVHLKKGQDILIESLVHLSKTIENIELYFVGDGESLEYLNELVVSNKLEGRVHFLGNKSRIWIQENLKEFDILVQPSNFEGFGLSLIEGIAAGIPVVASNIEGPSEILQEIPSGYLFIKGSSESCAETIEAVIAKYKQNLIQKLANQAFSIIEKKYSFKRATLDYIKFYENLIS